jgi:hypothetical protein
LKVPRSRHGLGRIGRGLPLEEQRQGARMASLNGVFGPCPGRFTGCDPHRDHETDGPGCHPPLTCDASMAANAHSVRKRDIEMMLPTRRRLRPVLCAVSGWAQKRNAPCQSIRSSFHYPGLVHA